MVRYGYGFATMSGGQHRVLHIGGSTNDAQLIREALTDTTTESFEVEWCPSLAPGLERLAVSRPSVVLLDLQVPDCPGMVAVERVLLAAATLPISVPIPLPVPVPVLVLGTDESDATAARVIRAGARDYLLTHRLDSYWLPRAIRHAIEQKLAEETLFAEAERVEGTLTSIGSALLSTDVSGRGPFVDSLPTTQPGGSGSKPAATPVDHALPAAADAGENGRTRSHHEEPGDGHEPRVPQGGEHPAGPGLADGVLAHIRAARAMSLRMSYLASHDPLTDLPNRLLLGDRLARALALAHRHRRRLAVLFLDLDHFKTINDSLGHAVGDELLRAVGREVTMCVRSSDTVSRQGGDEFVVVLSELEHVEDAARGAQKILAALSRPHQLAGHELHISVSVGISVYPDDGEDPETLLQRADMALYHAKDQGRDCYRFFKPSLNSLAVERQSIEAGLHAALEKREFELYYQPKINLVTAAIVGTEALIRWRHPDRGLIEPDQFVPIAEYCGLIRPIGRWVVLQACRQARAWQDAGFAPIPVSVNVSAVEFRSRTFLGNIVETLRETALDPQFLEVELTESALMAHVDTTNAVLRSLKDLGVRLAIDDFGTGWSSLSYLRHFPVDALKIDRSFVQEINSSAVGAPIVTAVINMAKALGQRVIAEGVETRAQLEFLRAEGCGEGQGYYFSPPITPEQFARALATGRMQA